MANILIVDDEKNLRRSLCIALEEMGHTIAEAANGDEAVSMVTELSYDIVITDLVMEDLDGIGVLRKVKEISPHSEVLLMSAHGTIAKAVEAMQIGAYDFIVKPFTIDHIEIVLNKMISQMTLKQTVKHLQAVLADHYLFEDIVADSVGMRDVMHQVAHVANWSVPVLIQGESGVGKEIIAMAIHHLSERKDKPFIPVNCGAFPDTLLDSELFGHCKGAFTGAALNKRGLIEEANGGTLLLDEIGESPQALQVRLLRFLDNGKFRRVGETTERQSDVRVIAATNRDIHEEIKSKRFREDLFYRLSVAMIEIPPLRERKEDIPALCTRFLELYSKRMNRPMPRIHPQTYQRFQDYDWPGNVRELENTIEHALIVTRGDEVLVSDLPQKFQSSSYKSNGLGISANMPLEEVVRRYILSVLDKTGGNKKRAAEILQISRTTLISRLKTYATKNECSNP